MPPTAYPTYPLPCGPSKMPANFQLYYITDRSQIKSRALDNCIAGAIAAGVDWVQIREKDLTARTLLALTEAALESARQQGRTRVMVNDRLDIALAAKAHGVLRVRPERDSGGRPYAHRGAGRSRTGL